MSAYERRFETEQLVPAPLKDVFAFFSLAENLERITPPFLRFKILTSLPIEMRQGTLIDYQLRIRGIPVRWRTQIADWNPPYQFVDTQLKGPYTLWHHTHTFSDAGAAGTLMRDVVRYQAPLGPLGLLVSPFFVRPEIERIFAFRRQAIAGFFPGPNA